MSFSSFLWIIQVKKVLKRDYKRELYNIFELYDYVLSSWHGYQEDENEVEKEEEDDYIEPPVIQQAISEKIGRNEPCPCGSGKKYKKCCMK